MAPESMSIYGVRRKKTERDHILETLKLLHLFSLVEFDDIVNYLSNISKIQIQKN
jgi:hypothetical protein